MIRVCAVFSRRAWLVALVALVFVHLLPGTLRAQQPSPAPPQKAQQLLELLEDPEVKSWLEGKGGAGATGAARPDSVADTISGWEASVRARLDGLAGAVLRLPREFANAVALVNRDVNSGRPGLVIFILAVLLAVGAGAEWLTRRALSRLPHREAGGSFARPALSGSLGLLAFALASVGVFLLFDWPPLLRRIVLTLLIAVIAVRVVWSATRFLFSVAATGGDPSVPGTMDRASARFWGRSIGVMAGSLLVGWAIVSLMPALGFSVDVVRLTALLFGLGILATAIHAVWRRPEGRGSFAFASALTAYLVVLWMLWLAGLAGLLFVGLYALLLPPLVRHAGSIAQFVAHRVQPGGALGVVFNVLIVRGARAAVIIVAVAWLAYVFRLRMEALAANPTLSTLFSGAMNAVIILLVADLVWQLAKALIAYRIDRAPDSQDPDALARSGRLRTLLPIFRNTLAALIATVTVMTILAGLGVQIGPLIAGAGIFGVAIGFGSQTLVKDVLSGVFYMLDDAFRVGEYIQSGSYMGTVESFSLRSVRLRHHRGPIFTVPFGELGAVQNMSRDWVIEKMTIKVTYDSDIDLARKLIKKIGQELAADPEFAADTIEPLKMQGIDNFGDFAVELKMKIMTKPNAQFTIKRRALMLIKKAFAENGIKIAVPTVHVEGGSDAAAAQQAIKMIQPQPVANQA